MKAVTELTKLTLADAREGLRGKQFSATELAQAFLAAIEAGNKALNAYVLATPERALAQAKLSDARLAKGDARPLEGLAVGIKDLYCTKGVRTTAGSNILDNFTPTYESTVTQNLWDAGAVMLGKLNCDEFAMGSSNETSCFGPVTNPWRRKGSNVALVPGGSSGGSSAAVAAELPAQNGGEKGLHTLQGKRHAPPSATPSVPPPIAEVLRDVYEEEKKTA